MISIPEKRCCTCKLFKPLDAFGRNSTKRDGRQPWCRLCDSECCKKYRRGEAYKKRMEKRKSNEEQLERDRKRWREYYHKNRERVLARAADPLYKARRALSTNRERLESETDPERREELIVSVEFWASEVERLEAAERIS